MREFLKETGLEKANTAWMLIIAILKP